MFTNIKLLAKDRLPIVAAALYTAPTGKEAQIGSIFLHNSGVTSQAVSLFLYGVTSADRLINIDLAANETYEFSPKVPFTLSGDEIVGGATTTAEQVNIFLFGRTEE
jgi:hypothetical protein